MFSSLKCGFGGNNILDLLKKPRKNKKYSPKGLLEGQKIKNHLKQNQDIQETTGHGLFLLTFVSTKIILGIIQRLRLLRSKTPWSSSIWQTNYLQPRTSSLFDFGHFSMKHYTKSMRSSFKTIEPCNLTQDTLQHASHFVHDLLLLYWKSE